jgi:ABC-type glycerol-3-phosphate transport system permease component
VTGAVILAAVGPLVAAPLVPALVETRPLLAYEGIVLLLIAIATVAIPFLRNRVAAVILLGAVGYLVGLLFIILHAPDLALTQILTETVALALFLLVLQRLPPYVPEETGRGRVARDLILSGGAGLALSHLTLVLPVAAWVLTTSVLAIPRQVEEAAAIDGCSPWQTLWRVTLRLATPGLVVAGLLAWLFSWEEFVLATYLTLGAKTMPLQVYYYLYQGNWFLTAACAALMTAPVLILSALLQRHLRGASLAGAIR